MVPPNIRVIEVAGCNHMNTSYKKANWQFITTASFCGGWWDGKCIDMNGPGYALMVCDKVGGLRQYYRSTNDHLAVASPKVGQLVKNKIEMDAIDPVTGVRNVETLDGSTFHAGWNTVKIHVGSCSTPIDIFCEPTIYSTRIVPQCGSLQFKFIEPPRGILTIHCNDFQIGQIINNTTAGETIILDIPNNCLREWTCIEIDGDAVISSPQLIIGGKIMDEARICRLEAVRPTWFEEMDIRTLAWDITKKRPMTPARHIGNRFFFLCNIGQIQTKP